jgi:hypothetical protein
MKIKDFGIFWTTSKQPQSKLMTLLHFRSDGQKAFENYVSTTYLKAPNTNDAVRKKSCLCTFSMSKSQKQRIKLVEQERKLSQSYLKQQLAWAAKHGIEYRPPGAYISDPKGSYRQ